MPHNILLECFTLHIPAKMQHDAAQRLSELFKKASKEFGLSCVLVESFCTTKRLILHANVECSEQSLNNAIRGPRVKNTNEAALQGFLKKYNAKIEDLDIQKIKDTQYYFLSRSSDTENVEAKALNTLQGVLNNFSWPKSMRWNDSRHTWIRPIVNLLCIIDGKILGLSFCGLKATNFSLNHSISEKFICDDHKSYFRFLKNIGIIYNESERRKIILAKINQKIPHGWQCDIDECLLEEMINFTENPKIIMGQVFIEQQKLLPDKLKKEIMHKHQKYLPCLNEHGAIAGFIAVSQKENTKVINGHERVLKARLQDGAFLMQQDMDNDLYHYLEKLKSIPYHEKLGTLYDKAQRIVKISKDLANSIENHVISIEQLMEAAILLKADLATSVVKEFPDLHGYIGGYYASKSNVQKQVCDIITQCCKEIDCKEKLIEAAIILLADKLDDLFGLLLLDILPSGSRDPFGLKRIAHEIIEPMIYFELKISIKSLSEIVKNAYSEFLDLRGERKFQDCVSIFCSYLLERMYQSHEESQTINVLQHDHNSDFFSINHEVTTLTKFVNSEEGVAFLQSYKRVHNFVGSKKNQEFAPKQNLISLNEELDLINEVSKVNSHYTSELEEHLKDLVRIGKLASYFLNNVRVLSENEDMNVNRQWMLSETLKTMDSRLNFHALIR